MDHVKNFRLDYSEDFKKSSRVTCIQNNWIVKNGLGLPQLIEKCSKKGYDVRMNPETK